MTRCPPASIPKPWPTLSSDIVGPSGSNPRRGRVAPAPAPAVVRSHGRRSTGCGRRWRGHTSEEVRITAPALALPRRRPLPPPREPRRATSLVTSSRSRSATACLVPEPAPPRPPLPPLPARCCTCRRDCTRGRKLQMRRVAAGLGPPEGGCMDSPHLLGAGLRVRLACEKEYVEPPWRCDWASDDGSTGPNISDVLGQPVPVRTPSKLRVVFGARPLTRFAQGWSVLAPSAVRRVIALIFGLGILILLLLGYIYLFTPLMRVGRSTCSFRRSPRTRQDIHPAQGKVPSEGSPVAVLQIPPRCTFLMPWCEGTDAQDLRSGPGHMPTTSLPGQPGNAVIAGRRATSVRHSGGSDRSRGNGSTSWMVTAPIATW